MSVNRLIYEFENFQLDAANRQLLRDGEPLPLPAKAFDVLLALVENSGRLVGKDELFQLVWGDQIVEESNLTVHISVLRKALGDTKNHPRLITTVPGYGYRFEGKVVAENSAAELTVQTHSLSRIVIEREEEDGDPENLPPQNASGRFTSDPPGALAVAAVSDAQPVSLTAKQISLRRWIIISLAALLITTVGAAAAIWLSKLRQRNQGLAGSRAMPALALRRFTTHGGLPFRAAISPDGKTLVYWQRINDKFSLWLGEIETNTSVPLNQQSDLVFDNLIFTPDGSNVYFNLGGQGRSRAMLGRMSVLGGAITELIPLTSPITFSPDGKQIAFVQRQADSTNTSLVIADADGQNQRTILSREGVERFSGRAVSWSRDGKLIAVSLFNANRREELAAVSVADGRVARIGNRDWAGVLNVQWLPDGSGLIVLVRENVGERRRQIWLVSFPDGEAEPITNDLNLFLQSELTISREGKVAVLQGHINSEIWIEPRDEPKQARRVLQGVAPRYEGVDGLAFTAEGRLLYTAYTGDSLVIWSINEDGGDLKQLTPGKPNSSDSNPCVTPDGRVIVFQSNRSGSVEIWRVNSDGSNLRQLTVAGNASSPSLSPDGQWIVYLAASEGKEVLSRVSINGGEPIRIFEASASMLQVSSDGRYIAWVNPSQKRLLIIPFEGGPVVKSYPVVEAATRGVKLRWTPDGKAIIYKGDPEGLWLQRLDEEAPQAVKAFESIPVRNLAWSVDGHRLAYASGPTTQEIILIEGFDRQR
jgi:Tol biopolymer transport system component/DNA-binding winged helix-turn-helix (wHTH) protein